MVVVHRNRKCWHFILNLFWRFSLLCKWNCRQSAGRTEWSPLSAFCVLTHFPLKNIHSLFDTVARIKTNKWYTIKFLSLEPFVPSGSNFEASKNFFLELGFAIAWDAGAYIVLKEMAVNSYCKTPATRPLRRILQIFLPTANISLLQTADIIYSWNGLTWWRQLSLKYPKLSRRTDPWDK